jgi:hypothetical protein
MSGRTLTRLADAGMTGPVVFGLTLTVLTFLEYDFMIGLGWDPIYSSAVPWPSALALGPYGYLQVANFVFFRGVFDLLRFWSPAGDQGRREKLLGESSVGYHGRHRDGALGLQGGPDNVRAPSELARLDPRPRVCHRRHRDSGRLLLFVAALQERPSLVGLWLVHPDQRDSLRDPVAYVLHKSHHPWTGGFLPVPNRHAGMDRGHSDPATFHRHGCYIRSTDVYGVSQSKEIYPSPLGTSS